MKIFRKWFFPNWQPVWTEKADLTATYIKTILNVEIPGTQYEVQDFCRCTIYYSQVRNDYKLIITGNNINPERWDTYKVAIEKLNELKGIKI